MYEIRVSFYEDPSGGTGYLKQLSVAQELRPLAP